jgi:hypothetical protein
MKRTQYNRYPDIKEHSLPERMLEYSRAYRERNPEKGIFRAARDRARKRGLEFSIDLEDVIIPDTCPILNIPLISRAGHGVQGGKLDSPSLDRIDNSKGYIKGNVQVISHMANSMKFTATPKELKMFAEWITKTYG